MYDNFAFARSVNEPVMVAYCWCLLLLTRQQDKRIDKYDI